VREKRERELYLELLPSARSPASARPARAQVERSALFVQAAWKVNSHSHPTRRNKYGFIRMEPTLSSTTQHAAQGVCVIEIPRICGRQRREDIREKNRECMCERLIGAAPSMRLSPQSLAGQGDGPQNTSPHSPPCSLRGSTGRAFAF
jgi:hypothetical protein